MKNENYLLKINNPCTENWDKMTLNNDGKFCNHCSKNVIDFTHLSDSQVIKIIQKSSGKVCGRMRVDQLNREMYQIIEKTPISFLYKILASTVLFFTSIKSEANSLRENFKSKTEISYNFNGSEFLEEKPIRDDTNKKYVFKGTVIDEDTKEPLSFVIIIASYGQKYLTATKTNLDGEFSIILPDSIKTETLKFVFNITGYISQSISLKKDQMNQHFLISLTEQIHMGEYVLIKKKKWWQRIFSKAH